MPSGWGFAWYGRQRFLPLTKCSTTGTVGWRRTDKHKGIQKTEVRSQKLVGCRLLVFAVLAADLVFAAAPLERFEAAEPHMGTLFRIELYASSREQAAAAFQAAF